ncbi:MAG: leucine-rich repeat protein, partial [Acutalibacteraceae bacterium]
MQKNLKRSLAVIMAVLMLITSAPLAGFVGLELPKWQTQAQAAEEYSISAGETISVDIAGGSITYIKFVPTVTGTFTFTSVSSIDTYGYLYDENKNQITSDDDDGTGNNFLITYDLEAGKTYYFGARYYTGSQSGSFNVKLTCDKVFCAHENTTEHAEVPATCEEYGYTAGVFCEDCQTWISGHERIERHFDENNDAICDKCGEIISAVVQEGSCGDDAVYTVYENGTMIISGNGEMVNSRITNNYSSINKVIIKDGITTIGTNAFNNYYNLTSVTIPDSVTSIGDYAFRSCSKLNNISLPSNITYLGENAFASCSSLKSIVIPESLKTFGYWNFVDCTALESVTLPETLEAIGTGVFSGCTALKEINIPDTVSYIGNSAFYNCISLTEITIPDSVTSVGSSAFRYCSAMRILTIGSSVGRIGCYAFNNCTSLNKINWNAENVSYFGHDDDYCCVFGNAGTTSDGLEVVFGDNVKSIPDYAFCGSDLGYYPITGNTNIKSVTIGNSVTSIGSSAFYGCTGLTKINWNAENVNNFNYSSNVFYNAGKSADGIEVVFGENVKSIPNYAFYVNNSSARAKIKSVTIGNNVESIGNCAFEYCSKLTDLTISNSVTSIGSYAFYGCTGLTKINWNAENVNNFNYSSNVFYNAGKSADGIEVVFGENVKSIPNYAFYVNNSSARAKIKSVTIGNNVESIGNCAFEYCSKLTDLTISNSVTNIGSSAFYGCTGLTKINWNAENVSSCSSSAFGNCGKAVDGFEVVFGENVKSIPNSAFSGNSYLKAVTLGSGVTSIGKYVFSNCTGLKEIIISESVETIGDNAFFKCGAESVIIKGNINTMGNSAFSAMPNLKTVTVEGNAVLGSDIFSYCHALETVEISGNVQSIPVDAFYMSENLKSVTLPESVAVIGDAAFAGCYALTDINLPEGIKKLPYNAFASCRSLEHIELPSTLEMIGDDVFYDCISLTDIVIPKNVKRIGPSAFYNCNNLSSIEILNPDCEIYASEYTINDSAVIFGKENSTAQKYAKTYGRIFETRQVESVSLVTKPDRTEYYMGDEFAIRGLSITVQYESGETETLKNIGSVSGFNSKEIGTSDVCITFGGKKTESFGVTVNERTITLKETVKVTVQPGQRAYFKFVPKVSGYYYVNINGYYSTYAKLLDSNLKLKYKYFNSEYNYIYLIAGETYYICTGLSSYDYDDYSYTDGEDYSYELTLEARNLNCPH